MSTIHTYAVSNYLASGHLPIDLSIVIHHGGIVSRDHRLRWVGGWVDPQSPYVGGLRTRSKDPGLRFLRGVGGWEKGSDP